MQKLKHIIIVFFILLSLSSYAISENNNFPKTKEEEARERMGSILGEKGIEFKFSKKNHHFESKKDKEDKVKKEISLQKKYLWQAIIKTLNYAPIAVIDPENGIFITEWFSREERENISQKITILIKSDSSPIDFIEVILQQKIKNKNRWVEKNCKSGETENIKQQIILAAKKEIETNNK